MTWVCRARRAASEGACVSPVAGAGEQKTLELGRGSEVSSVLQGFVFCRPIYRYTQQIQAEHFSPCLRRGSVCSNGSPTWSSALCSAGGTSFLPASAGGCNSLAIFSPVAFGRMPHPPSALPSAFIFTGTLPAKYFYPGPKVGRIFAPRNSEQGIRLGSPQPAACLVAPVRDQAGPASFLQGGSDGVSECACLHAGQGLTRGSLSRARWSRRVGAQGRDPGLLANPPGAEAEGRASLARSAPVPPAF